MPSLIQSDKQSTESHRSTPNGVKRYKADDKKEEAIVSKGKATLKPEGRVRGRRGHLKQMIEMPMDVLYEIFSFLEPIDLLHLSWTSKRLRSTIAENSARFIWENAFKPLYGAPQPLPHCPPDLNLAQYTKLLFVKHCMECNSQYGSYVLWPHRLRVCGSCLESERFTTLTTSNKYWLSIPVMRMFVHGKINRYVLTSELNDVQAKMESVNTESGDWTNYLEQRELWMNSRRLDEWNFMRWQVEQERDKKNNTEEIRVKRRNAIVAKLTDLGWKKDLDRLTTAQVLALPGMKTAKPLTEKAWEKICPELIECLEASRELRLKLEEGHRIAKHCRNLSKKISFWAIKQPQLQDMLPTVLDVAFNEPFKSFIFDDSDTEPAFITDKDELAKTMEQFTEEWNRERDQFLFSLLPESSGKSSAKGKDRIVSSALHLATTFFRCSSGQTDCPSAGDAIPYPDILTHNCQRSLAKKGNLRNTDPEGLAILSTRLYTRPWLLDCHELVFDQRASFVARMVVQECGENPDEVTTERMSAANCRLECIRCSEPKKGRCVMKWDAAIRHGLDKHSVQSDGPSHESSQKGARRSRYETNWCLVTDPKDLAFIYAREKGATTRRASRTQATSSSITTFFWI